MAQQSSIEYLEAIINHCKRYHRVIEQKDIDQAKAMHRQEIEDAFVAGSERGINNIPFNCEQYYTQTFGKKTFTDLVSNEVSPVHEVIKRVRKERGKCITCEFHYTKMESEPCCDCKVLISSKTVSYFKPKGETK